MVDLDAMDADPWPTWPVDKNELRGLVDEIERLRERRDDWRAAMAENHDLWNENERLRAEIQQLKHDSTIFINERSDAICENFDLREENAELREKIERLRAALREKDNIAYIIDSHGMTHQSFVIVYSAALAGEKANDAAT